MILADADVLFRWTDNSFSITGWGGVLVIILAILWGVGRS